MLCHRVINDTVQTHVGYPRRRYWNFSMQKYFMAAVSLAGLPAGTVALDCAGDGDSLL